MEPRHLPLRPHDRYAVWLEAVTNEERRLSREYECALYRFYDTDRVLLYVGLSRNLPDRWNWHRCKASWWDRVRYVAVSFYPTRTETYLAEGAAIRLQNPLFNVMRPKPHRSKRCWIDDALHAPPPPRLLGEG